MHLNYVVFASLKLLQEIYDRQFWRGTEKSIDSEKNFFRVFFIFDSHERYSRVTSKVPGKVFKFAKLPKIPQIPT